MLRSKTVVVLGAGASKEVGLPVGEELKKEIAVKLDIRFEFLTKPIGKGDLGIFNVLYQTFPSQINEYLAACWRIRDGVVLSPSIDDFIDTHCDDTDVAACGKVAIARSILEAERRSSLFYERRNISDSIDFPALERTWYPAFYQLLTQGMTRGNLQQLFTNLKLVTFNYDRCFEHFLVHAIATHYHTPVPEARQLVEGLPIFRPYGSVGPYFGSQPLEFGFKGLPPFDHMTKNLRTYTEQVADKVSLQAMREAISEAETLIFLGNAFHENNMNLLIPDVIKFPNKRIFATRKGISNADLAIVNFRFAKLRGESRPAVNSPYYYAEGCSDLFDTYRMLLRV